VAEVFFASRVEGMWRTAGTSSASDLNCSEVLARVTPQV
jgi:hypothetical protein